MSAIANLAASVLRDKKVKFRSLKEIDPFEYKDGDIKQHHKFFPQLKISDSVNILENNKAVVLVIQQKRVQKYFYEIIK